MHGSEHTSSSGLSNLLDNYVFNSNYEVEKFAVNMEKTEQIQKKDKINGLGLEGSDLVEIPITNEFKRLSQAKTKVTWKRTTREGAKKVPKRSQVAHEQTKKRKT